MALAMRERPDLMAAYANVLSADQYNLEATKDDRWPTISAVANLTYGYEYGGVTHGNPSNNYMVGLQLSWQIFTGFEKTYAILNAQEQANAARENLRQQELKVVTDVWNFSPTKARCSKWSPPMPRSTPSRRPTMPFRLATMPA